MLGEKPNMITILGGAITLIGVLITQLKGVKPGKMQSTKLKKAEDSALF
jgi:drug/metabolite transporter (DMT)-like permease